MIDRDHKLCTIRQASLLNISRGSVYYLATPVNPADLVLMRRIDELHLEHPSMGTRMLRDQLARQDVHVGRHVRTTLMLRMGIEALTPQTGTSKAAPGHKIYPYPLRKLAITRPNQVWAPDRHDLCTDGLRLRLPHRGGARGSRRVLAHKVAVTLEALHATEVIEQAFARYGAPEIVNTDQGTRFTAKEFTRVVLARAKFLPGTTNYQGGIGRIAFDEKGDLRNGSIAIYVVKAEKWQALETLMVESL